MPAPLIIVIAQALILMAIIVVIGGALGVAAIVVFGVCLAIRAWQLIVWIYRKVSNPRQAAPGFSLGTDMMTAVEIDVERLAGEVGPSWLMELEDLHLGVAPVADDEIERLLAGTDSQYARELVRELAKYR